MARMDEDELTKQLFALTTDLDPDVAIGCLLFVALELFARSDGEGGAPLRFVQVATEATKAFALAERKNK